MSEMSEISPSRDAMMENMLFHEDFKNALREATQGMPYPRVLDYGAGVVPYDVGQFHDIQPGQRAVAYDPHLSQGTSESFAQWTDQEQKVNLI